MKKLNSLFRSLDSELPVDRQRAVAELRDIVIEITWKIKESVGDSNSRVQREAADSLAQIGEAASTWIVDPAQDAIKQE